MLIYILKNMFSNEITLKSIPHMIYYITEFSNVSVLYYGLVIALTGIPPFVLFFIKFNFLLDCLHMFDIFIFYLLVIGFFLNIFFY